MLILKNIDMNTDICKNIDIVKGRRKKQARKLQDAQAVKLTSCKADKLTSCKADKDP